MESFVHIQGDSDSHLAPLILIHAVSGLALPYCALGSLTGEHVEIDEGRPVYGISSPLFTSNGYRLPKTMDHIAHEYVMMMARQLRSKGTFILGGWSFGGMVAMRMAKIMRSQGMKVLRVIMIDSVNPDRYPAFADKHEQKSIAMATFNPIKERLAVPLAQLMMMAEDDGSGDSTPDSSDDEGDEMPNILPLIYQHIQNGLDIISKKESRSQSHHRCRTPISLIKCQLLEPLPAIVKDARRKLMKKGFTDPRLGWHKDDFDDFETVPFSGTHDGAFDSQYVEDLTYLMRDVLNKCR